MKPLIVLTLFFCYSTLISQPLTVVNSTHYGRDEGTMTSPVFNMAKDACGFVWFSSRVGTQRFDGTKFHNIPMRTDSKGILDNQDTKFFNLKDGRLAITHCKGVSIYDVKTNTFENHAFDAAIINESKNLELIYETQDEYWFINSSEILCFNKDFTFKKAFKTVFSHYNSLSYAINKSQEKLYLGQADCLYLFDFKTHQLTSVFKKLDTFIAGLYTFDNGQVLIFQTDGWCIWSPANQFLTLKKPYPNDYKQLLTTTLFKVSTTTKDRIIVAFGTQLWEFNSKKQVFSHIFVNNAYQNLIDKGYFSSLLVDGEQSLWLASNIEGLQHVNTFSRTIKYYGTPNRKVNFTKCLLVDKKSNRVICGTYEQGILIFDTLQQLIKHIPHIETTQPDKNIVTTIIDLNDDECLFFLYSSTNFYVLNKKTGAFRIATKWGNMKAGQTNTGYYNTLFKDNKGKFYYQIDNYLAVFAYKNGQFFLADTIPNRIGSSGFFFKNGHFAVSCFDTLSFFDHKKNTYVKAFDKMVIKHMVLDQKDNIWLGMENKLVALAPPQYQTQKEWTTQNGLPDNTIYALAVDKKNRLWFSHNKGISMLYKNAVLTFNKKDGLQENEFNTAAVDQSPDGELFFGGINGVSSFYPDDIIRLAETPSVFLTNLTVSGASYMPDTALWNVENIVLPYNKNTITLDYSALGLNSADNYNFQVQMNGIDAAWVNMGQQKTIRYQLPAGSYRFDMFAARSFDENAKPMRRLTIVIKPPFWKTWWFIIGAITAFGITLWQLIRLYFYRKYQIKLRELATQKQIQQEKVRISRDLHDNMGAQLSHIVRSVEWFSSHNQLPETADKNLLTDINISAKEAMNILRESIWTLNKETITVEDFLERFKKFAFQQIKSAPKTELIFKENIEKNNTLTPEQSLQLYRILQEAMNNALKYAQATKIILDIQSSDNQLFKIVFTDNGQGFDIKEALEKGNGLANMQQRAEGIGAAFSIISEKANGVKISVSLSKNTTNV
jgi:signal transduction histidine kinase/ligand-binding sensor domain-containing protein